MINNWKTQITPLDNAHNVKDGVYFDQTMDWFKAFHHYCLGAEIQPYIANAYFKENEVLTNFVFTQNKNSELQGLSNYYTSHGGPYIVAEQEKAGDETIMCSMLISSIFNHFKESPKLSFYPFTLDDAARESFKSCLKIQKLSGFYYIKYGNWYLDVGKMSFDEYWQQLPSKLRSTLTRKKKKLLKSHDYQIEIHTTVDDVKNHIKQYFDVYAKSWKTEEGYPEFIEAFAIQAAQQGWTRLGILSVDDTPVAAQLWFVKSRIACIFKLSYDEAYKQLSVGSILTEALMKYAFEVDKVKEVDYLNGDDAYKKDWMTARREMWTVEIYNMSNIRGLIGGTLANIKQIIKPSIQ